MSYDINEAFLAGKSYKLGDANKGQTITGPNGSQWFVVDAFDNKQSGYQGALLKNVATGKYELVSRGTEFEREPIKDGVADLQMGLGQLPDQVSDARAFLKNSQDFIADKGGNPNTDLSLTGHSLGGSITQVLGAENPQLKATAFNPYGTGNLIPEGSHPNITNHISSSDSVSSMPGSNMPGQTLRYESTGGHGIGQFVDESLANQSGTHVTINMPPVQGIDGDPMGTGDGAAIMNAANGESSPEPEIPEIVVTAPRETHTLENYLNTEGSNLTTKQQDALASQLDKLNLGGESALSIYTLPSGGALIANADGDIVGEILRSESGDLNLRATAIAEDGSAVQVNQHINEQGSVQTQEQYNTQAQAQASAMFNSLMAANNWSHLTDVGKLSALVNLYNATDKLGEAFNATGDNLPGDLGAAAGYLQLAQGLQSGDSLVIANGINVISDGALDSAMNQAFGTTAAGEAVPYLSYALAVRNFADNPEQAMLTAAGTYVGEAIGMAMGGPIGAAIGGAIGGMIGGSLGGLFGDDDPPPPPVGHVHFAFNAAGQIEVVVDQDQSGGGQAAKTAATAILSGILAQLNQASDPQHPELALTLNPFTLPKLGYNGGYYLECTDLNGISYTMRPGNDQLGQSFFEHVKLNHAVIPQWEAQTLQEHFELTGVVPTVSAQALTTQADVDPVKLAAANALEAQANAIDQQVNQLDQQTIQLHKEIARLERTMRTDPSEVLTQSLQDKHDLINDIKAQVADLRQQASDLHVQSAHDLEYAANQQTYRVLTVQVQEPVVPETAPVLRDVDGDGYLEQTQWVQKNQAILGIDLNGDGVLGSNSELLNLDSGNSFNSARWLDANQDGVLSASDPAFAALKLWGSASGESLGNVKPADMDTMAQAQIVSINLRTGQVQYADGSSNALTEQTLSADVQGVKAQQQVGGLAVDNEDGEKLLYAINTNEFEGQANHIHRGEALVFQGATAVKTAKDTGTQSNTVVANTQLSNGAAGTATSGQASGAQSTQVAQASQVRSAVGLGFVPTGESSAQNELRQVTDAMIQSADSALFGGLGNSGGGATLGALGLVAGGMGVQMPALASETPSFASNGNAPSSNNATNPTAVPVFTSTSGGTNSGTSQSSPITYVSAAPNVFQSEPVARAPIATSPTVTAAVSTSFTSDLTPAAPVVQNTGASSSPTIVKNTSPTPAAAPPSTTSGASNVVAEVSTPAPVLEAPTVQGETLAGTEDVVLRIPSSTLLANDTTVNAAADANRPLLSINAVANPTHGQVGLNNGDVVFIPDANFHGTATFTYTVVDQYGLQSTATATLEIAAVNDAPVTTDQSGSTNEDNIVYFNVADLLSSTTDADTSTDGQTLAISGIVSSSHGLATLTNDGRIKFVPDANFHGTANFIYTGSDGNGGETPAKVFVQVASVNDVPVATGEIDTTNEDTAIVFTQSQLLANDTDDDIATDGQVLSISAVSGAVNGVVTLMANGDVRFVPNVNYHGSAQFTYTVTDSNGGTANADVNLTVLALNDAPVAVGDVLSIAEDAPVTITPSQLLGNDTDADISTDSDVITISRVFGAQHCTVTLNTDGTISLLPEANYHGNARFSYEIVDSLGVTSVATVIAGVNAVNDAPIANSDSTTATEDSTLLVSAADLLANDTDADLASDGDAISVASVGNALHGSVRLLSNGNIEFTPDANFHGTAGFDYVATDTFGATSTAHVTVAVGAVNDAPVVQNDTTDTAEDTAVEWQSAQLLANASDADVSTDGQVLSIASVSNAQHGLVSLDAGGKVTFTPDLNYHGAASFQYAVSDSNGGVTLGTVTLDVAGVNDIPVAAGDTGSTNEDTAIVFTQAHLLANDSDVDSATDGQVLSISAVSGATNGTVSILANGDIQFIPNANYHGAAQFTYTVSDSNGGFADTVVSLSVLSINDAPVATGDVLSSDGAGSPAVTEDMTLAIAASTLLANDTDVDVQTDGQVLSIASVFGATHGSVSLVTLTNGAQQINFTPDLNYNGPAQFSYTVTDGNGGMSNAVATLVVAPVNDLPIVQNETGSVDEDNTIYFMQQSLLANDTDVDTSTNAQTLSIDSVSAGTNGTVGFTSDGRIFFRPNDNYNGNASFTYTVSDGAGGLVDGQVQLTITPVNDAPVALGESTSSSEDVPLLISVSDLLVNDSDIDNTHSSITVTAVANALHGTASLITQPDGSQRVLFTPEVNYHGIASFEYTVTDPDGLMSTATTTIAIAAVNDTPVTAGESAQTDEDVGMVFTQAQLLANDIDVDIATDGDSLHVSRVGAAAHGTAFIDSQGQVRFVPDANYHGAAQFTYWVADSFGAETPALLNIVVAPVNDLPVVVSEETVTQEDTTLYIDPASLLANDTDPDTVTDGQVLSVSTVSNATHGSVTLLANGSIEFVPDVNFHGVASFDYTVSDGNGGTSVSTAVIRISAVNDAPVTLGESATGDEDNELIFTSAALLANDSDVDVATDGQVLSISRVGVSSHGTVSLDAQGQVHFTPDANYHGAAQFTYWVSDSNGAETPAVVTLTIAAVNDLPVVNGEVVSSTEDVTLLFNAAQLLANDSDADVATDGQVLSISAVSNAQHGTVSIKANGQIEFIPDANFAGAASFDYMVSDGAGGSRVATATINLAPVNDAPVVVGEVIDSTEDVPLNIQTSLLLANDSDIDNPASDLRIVSVGSATHGTINLNSDGSITFAPDLNYFGPASFVYTVSDGSGGFTAGTANLNIAPLNDAPLAVGDSLSLDEDVIAHFSITSLLANDSDVDNAHSDLVITGVSAAVGGAVQIVGGEIVFTPALNFNGQASFQYSVADGVGGVTQATVSINFNPVNDAPVASDVNYDAKRNVAYTISASTLLQQGLVDDIDSGAASVQLVGVTNAQHCSVSYNSITGVVTVNPVAGYSGLATFDYVVQDPQGLQTTAHANINFVIANTAPIATDDSFVGDEDTSFIIAPAQLLSNDWDQDNVHSDLSITSVTNPHNGTVSVQNGNVVFTPNANFSGNADFQYQVSDGAGGSTWATAYVTVNPINDAPVITSTTNSLDPYTVYSGGGESGTATASGSRRIGDVNAFDVEGDTIHFGIYAQPDHGYLTIDANTGHWIYSTTATTQTGTSFTNITANTDTYFGGVDFSFYAEDSHGARTISQTIHAEYHGTSSAGVAQTIAPIVIDLGNDGLDLVNPSQSPFEYRSENALEPARYGWVGANDGLLAFDQNHDGTINSLNEISYTGYLEGAKTDLEGLAAFDSNHDGVVNASDAKWSDFGVFQDKNQNGVCDAGEFISLAEANITQIDLQRTGESKVVAGNIVFGDATVHRTDGTTTTAGDVAFVRDDMQAPTHEAVQSFLKGQTPLILTPAPIEPSEIASDVHPVVSAATDNLDAINAAELAEYARIRQMANYFNQVVATATVDPSVDSPALGYVDFTSLHHADMISSLIDVKNAQSSFEAHS